MSQEKILVIGANGFIGKSLVKQLTKNGIPFITHKDVGIDITQPSSFKFNDSGEIKHVIHLAGKTFVPDSWKIPNEFLQVNTLGTQNVAEFCKENKTSLTYVSAYIYGSKVVNPIAEDHPIDLNNPYALSKKLGEDICLFYADNFKVPVSIVRPFNVYGIGQNEAFLIPEVIQKAKTCDRIEVKDLSPKRDFIYVDDVSDLIIEIYKKNIQGIFNAGTGISYSVEELIKLVQKILNKNLPVVSENIQRVNEISDTVANIEKAKKIVGWSPKNSLEEGLKKIIFSE